MAQVILVGLGGALGSGARYLVGLWAAQTLGVGLPYGTFLVNAVGSFLISVVMVLGVDAGLISQPVRLFLATGVMGGFTTYSSFNYETLKLLESGAWAAGAANVLLTLVSCGASGLLGLLLGARLAGLLGAA